MENTEIDNDDLKPWPDPISTPEPDISLINNNEIEELNKEYENIVEEKCHAMSYLESTDYKIIKCAEYIMQGKQSPYNLEELNESRDNARKIVNESKKHLEKINERIKNILVKNG